jgi:hypothetical protein
MTNQLFNKTVIKWPHDFQFSLRNVLQKNLEGKVGQSLFILQCTVLSKGETCRTKNVFFCGQRLYIFLIFKTQAMHIKSFYIQLKTLYYGGIRTWVFLFLRRMRCLLRHAVVISQWNVNWQCDVIRSTGWCSPMAHDQKFVGSNPASVCIRLQIWWCM